MLQFLVSVQSLGRAQRRDGHSIAQALIILLAYMVVFAAVLGILDWYRQPAPELPITRETEAEAAAVAVPAGVAI